MATEQAIPEDLVELFVFAIDAYGLVKDGHNVRKAMYDGKPRDVGEIAKFVSRYHDKMPPEFPELLARVGAHRPYLLSQYLKRDGSDTFADGGRLLRRLYDDAQKRRAEMLERLSRDT
jgi:hypothetical protein